MSTSRVAKQVVRHTSAIALVAVLTVAFVGSAAAGTLADQLLAEVNDARTSVGRESVQYFWDLRDDAERHAAKMADQQRILDIPNIGDVAGGWKSLSQVNSVGADTSTLFDLLMNSYNSVILGAYNYVGIGAVVDENGLLWVSMIFMQHPDDRLNGSTFLTTSPESSSISIHESDDPVDDTDDEELAGTGGSSSPAVLPARGGYPIEPSSTTGASPTTSSIVPPTTTPPEEESVLAAGGDPGGLGGDPAAAAPGTGDDASDDVTRLIIIGVVAAVAVLGITWLVLATRGTPAAATQEAARPIVFEPCGSCGVLFNQARKAACPRCGAPAT